jgi:penicillin amidase
MDDEIDRRRRALVLAALGGGTAGAALSPVGSFLDRFTPFSGSVWRSALRDVEGTVATDYGRATVSYDEDRVAHVEGDSEAAVYHAVGYAQAADRLFQMDVLRRRMRGRLSELAGEATVDSDRFYREMMFRDGAEATWDRLEGTETGDLVEAYVDGVNAYAERERLPLEFSVLEYDFEEWTPVDTFLQQQQISWGLTGSFETLRVAAARQELGAERARELYPARLDHDAAILDEAVGGRDPTPGGGTGDTGSGARRRPDPASEGVGDLARALTPFESPPGTGSNSWVVGGEHTESGQPIVANDPHLTLTAPPVWYEVNLHPPEYAVRGVTFPGVPFVIIGENDAGAWGFTNANADVIDFYAYDEVDTEAGTYRYRGETESFDGREETIAVSGGQDRTVEVRSTVHGPYVERGGTGVGVAWTGHTATATTEAVREMARSDGVEEFLDALRDFDLPTQNVVYADRSGATLQYVTGRIPDRSGEATDAEGVPGRRVYDGSAGEGEWGGFEPFGESTWEGFLAFEEKPGRRDVEYLATANQRIADDLPVPIAESYSDPFRGQRIYERLDALVEDGPVTPAEMRDLQLDTYDGRAELLVPAILAARDRMDEDARALADDLEGWDFRMTRDSRAALVFARWFLQFRAAATDDEAETLAPPSGERSAPYDTTPGSYYPNPYVLATLPADSPVFDGDRAGVIATAMEETVAELDREGWQTYGDYARTDFDHPFGSQLSFLNYPAYPADGGRETVRNFRPEQGAGASWRMVCPMAEDAESRAILPGGNSGDYFSEQYHDQLRRWADGEFKSMSLELSGEPTIGFFPRGDG